MTSIADLSLDVRDRQEDPLQEELELTDAYLAWEPDPDLDIDYHIRHSALPKPGRYRELFSLVS